MIPGNIIFKQRGTRWHAGENAIRGRDHTIHAAVTGYVKYYRDPEVHPTRQFIGVAFNKEDTLPYPKDEPRRRKLNLDTVVRKEKPTREPGVRIGPSGLPLRVVRKGGLFNIERLKERLWSREKMREIRAAREKAGMVKRAGRKTAKRARASTAGPTSESPDTAASSTETSAAQVAAKESETVATPVSATRQPRKQSKKRKGSNVRRRLVMPQEFLQKRWLERRRTRVLHLNPYNYSYTESNAAIGRLASRTMYTPPWKLGGRKSRFRAQRKKREEKLKKTYAHRAMVKVERKKEKAAAEERRRKLLEKQRAEGAKMAKKAQAAVKAAAEAAEKKDAQAPKPTEP